MSEAKSTGMNLPILLGIIVLVVLLTAGTSFLMIFFFNSNQTKDKVVSAVENEKLEELGPTFEMGEFVVNLSGTRGYRFIKTNIVVEVEKDSTKQILEQRTPQLRDAINEILRSQQSEDIEDPTLVNLKLQILERINQILVTEKIKSVWLTEFVLQ
ncbi:MAG: flagellar basal body-associated FliL family protein [Halanaerobiales bacterium]|nr:flagellar basal body-associated FliL family protein [Halanaerobiales bacterium]